jgi:DMSO/TMAO reductase YedYZ molybdopterin-dependent catalytic subunit
VDRGLSAREAAGLIVRNEDPLNCETRISALMGHAVTPNEHFYIRSHFAAPKIEGSSWRLDVGGLVERPFRLSLEELERLPAQVETVTLECAGNGRAFLEPNVAGEQWAMGAVSTAEWTGVRLAEILDRAGVQSEARGLVFKGGDGATADPVGSAGRFDRSLTLDEARESEVLLAYLMNGEPLSGHHGYPVRAVVPGWYGVASVKWLAEIEVIDRPFIGHFQTERYVFKGQRHGVLENEPVRQQRVRGLITHPEAGDEVDNASVSVRGFAWSGVAPVARVEISVNGGACQRAVLSGRRSTHCWQAWEAAVRIDKPGLATIRARAADEAGREQPEQPEWNSLGYGNNAIHEVTVRARG